MTSQASTADSAAAEPHLLSEALCDASIPSTATMHQVAQLHSEGLLALLLDPDLREKLTPGAIIAADNRALFQLLPVILSAVQRIGEHPSDIIAFRKLVSILRKRIVACRGLKLRFLLLINNPSYARHWVVRMVHRRHCYAAARLVLADLANDDSSRHESLESVAIANSLNHTDSASSAEAPVPANEYDTHRLVSFAARSLLNPRHGVRVRTIMFHLRPVQSAFFGPELVESIMELGNVTSREDAVKVAQRLMDIKIITKVDSSSHRFVDDRRRLYQCNFDLQREDDGQCHVKTSDGHELATWDAMDESKSREFKQISVQVPMDMVDLQSLEFWTNSVYVRGIEKGFRYGYRAIAHPLFCDGINAQDRLDYTPVADRLELAVDELERAPSNAGSMVGSDEINDLQQDGAVVGSVIVRKVFSSIARPMIIQLRVPIEHANLEEDEHHIVMPPGLLVKEGDNLMQDLGVETMFQCFNHLWRQSALESKYNMVPESLTYEVFPTSTTQGFMEAVTGLQSLKEYDWKKWRREHGDDEERVQEMVRTTVGSYVGAYVVGGRDRHFDNVLVKDDTHMLHIDFGFLLGTSPPIDGPPIAIAPQMEMVFREVKVWQTFVDLFVEAFMVLRSQAPAIVRMGVLIFGKAGYEEHQIRHFLQDRMSLNTHENERKAGEHIKKQLTMSSGAVKTRFKQFAHEHIDPAWYGLLEKGFPPAVAIMKVVDAQRASKKGEDKAGKGGVGEEVRENERLDVQE